MIIRYYKKEDYFKVNKLGGLLHTGFDYVPNEFTFCMVCEDNDDIVGFITYMKMYERAEIIDIVIDPVFRNKGYGSLLLDKAIEDINENNVDSITLEVNCNNAFAIGLYKKIGFKIVAVRKNYYGNEDGYLMEKILG